MNLFAILTRFKHHKPDGGYKRLITELKQSSDIHITEFGNDETCPNFPNSLIDKQQHKYKWIAEWRAWKHVRKYKPDIIHIMYGEEYFRFSHRLFPRTPIIATFHQPADLLEREIKFGDHGGRVSAFTHRMNSNRFKSLSAAIVTNSDQKTVLEKVMKSNKIHVIPLGVDVTSYRIGKHEGRDGVLTLGNWFRDWNTYFEVVKMSPSLKFHLVNRQLPSDIRQNLQELDNCTYHEDISDVELKNLTARCNCAFLPLQKLAGSNALLECLVGGLPLVLSDVNAEDWATHGMNCISLFEPQNAKMASSILLSKKDGITVADREACVDIANTFAWPSIANKTIEIYKEVI